MKKVLKAIAVLLVFAAVVFAAGCAGKTGNTGNNTGSNTGNKTQVNTDQLEPINPITSQNVTNNTTQANETMETGKVVTEADNGKTIRLKKGESFTVSLKEDPSAGYLWKLNLTDGLSILEDDYIEGLNPEHLAGVPGTHLWVIEATAPGSQKVNGVYKRSRGNTTGTEENFTLTVNVT